MGSRRLNVPSYLSHQPLFKGMNESELVNMADASQLRRLGRGDAIFQAGEACEALYLVVEGLVKLYARGAQGQEKVIEVAAAGECVSEALMFSDVAHSVNACALTDVLLLVIPKSVLLQAINGNGELAIGLITRLSRRFTRMVKDIEALTLQSGVERVVDYLLQSPVVDGGQDTVEGDITVSLPASKGTIASLLSVTPEHFSRILHELQANGLIAVNRRQIHIPDVQRLACYS